jgi:acyl-CoA synthetase (AMP-forming)/AMP-acid ligase II
MYAAGHAADHPDRPAIVMLGSGETWTYGQYEERANRVAHFLRRQGLRRGDHVAVLAENNPWMLAVEGAAERTGLYYTLVNSYLSADEVAYIVDNCRARVFFATSAKADVAKDAAHRTPDVERFVMIGPDRAGERWELLDQAVAGLPGHPVSDEQLGAAMLYSSGTTGQPKGIKRPLPDMHPGQPLPVMEFAMYMYGVREGMTYLNPAPLYHSAPQASVSMALRLGSTTVVMEHFDPEQWLAAVEQFRITHSQMVPTMFHRLLRLPDDVRKKYDLSSLETLLHAAAPCPIPVKQAMIDWVGPIVREYYGATESNGFTLCTSEEWMARPGTVGRAILGQIVIRDEDGREQPPGVDGTVWFRGATNFEYFDDPEKTAANRDEDGQLSTVGDVGHVDEEGWLYLTDRRSYMIISGGVNIYPQETENLLSTHPAVADAAVIGVPDEEMGEAVKAVVQPAPGHPPGPDLERELIAFCRQHLAHFKCPRSIDFTDELPRLPTGKLYKRILRDRYWEGHTTRIA